MKKYQIDWVQFAAALIIVAAMVVAFPLMCIISATFVVILGLSRATALFSAIADAHREDHEKRGRK